MRVVLVVLLPGTSSWVAPVWRAGRRLEAVSDDELVGNALIPPLANGKEVPSQVNGFEEEWKAHVVRAVGKQPRRAPLGALAASKEDDYEEWISGQLRLNRIQSCAENVKSDVVSRLDSLQVDGVDGMLRQLVDTSNGVRDRAQTSLLTGVWRELLPARAIEWRNHFFEPSPRRLGRMRRSRYPGSPKWIVERERRWLGPLLSTAFVYEGRALSTDILRLRRVTWGGTHLKLLSFIKLPLVSFRQQFFDLKLLFVDTDFVVAAKSSSGLLVWAKPSLARVKQPFFRRALFVRNHNRKHNKNDNSLFGALRWAAPNATAATTKPEDTVLSIGDPLWAVDTAMDIDDDQMQVFLDKPEHIKSTVSVQDLLDGNIPASASRPNYLSPFAATKLKKTFRRRRSSTSRRRRRRRHLGDSTLNREEEEEPPQPPQRKKSHYHNPED